MTQLIQLFLKYFWCIPNINLESSHDDQNTSDDSDEHSNSKDNKQEKEINIINNFI
jgi:hypothetical protein